MAKKVKLSAKIALDIIMFVALIFLYKAKVLTLTYHEVMGLGIALFFLVHCLFNRTWIVDTGKKLFSKSTPARTKFSYWITILLVIDFLLIIVSGIFISKIIFRDAISSLNLGDTSIFRNIHLFCSALSLILIGIHVGIYWPMVKGFFAKRINLPKRVGTTLAYVLLAVIVATGVYSLPTSSFTNWLASPFVQQTGHDHGHGDQAASGDATASAESSHGHGASSSESTSATASESSSNSTGTTTEEATTPTEKHGHGAAQADATGGEEAASATSASESESTSAESASESAASASAEQKTEKTGHGDAAASASSSTSASSSAKAGHGDAASAESTSDTASAKSANASNHGNVITPQNIVTTFYQYTSIVGLFAIITYYIDRALRKRAKAKRDAAKASEA